jgi:hypothetical protein
MQTIQKIQTEMDWLTINNFMVNLSANYLGAEVELMHAKTSVDPVTNQEVTYSDLAEIKMLGSTKVFRFATYGRDLLVISCFDFIFNGLPVTKAKKITEITLRNATEQGALHLANAFIALCEDLSQSYYQSDKEII